MQTHQQPYQQVYCGVGNLRGNADNNLCGKVATANFRLLLVISARPAPPGIATNTAPRPLIPPSQPRRKGSALGAAKTSTKRDRGEPTIFDNSRSNRPTQITD